MQVLLDTNIVIHREAATVVDKDIDILFKWLDNLHHPKHIRAVTTEKIEKHENPKVRRSFHVKLANYNILKQGHHFQIKSAISRSIWIQIKATVMTR